jgi:hypothetical protein
MACRIVVESSATSMRFFCGNAGILQERALRLAVATDISEPLQTTV